MRKSPSKASDSRSNPPEVNGIQAVGDGTDWSSDPRWLLAQRVEQSETFRHSARLRGFLLFIVERTVRGRAAELAEYEIGTQVFDRSADFNPADDSIVRSSARLLRAKLKEYFDGEGRDEPLLIEVPKGGYVPEFVARATRGTATSVEIPAPRASRAVTAIYALSVACVLLLILCLLLWRSRAVPELVRASTASASNLIFSIFQPGAALNVVYPNSAARHNPRPPNEILDERLHSQPQETPAGGYLITSYRDAVFGLRLSELASREGRILIPHHSRLIQARDFRAGNYILLGGVLSNSWTALFESQLNFRLEVDPSDPRRYRLRNVAPRPGEAPFYWFPAEGGTGTARYARITLTPNLTGTGKVLMLAGQSAEGTEGAGDAALSRDFARQVQALAGNRPLWEITSLELLLEVDSLDGAARGAKILAYRMR